MRFIDCLVSLIFIDQPVRVVCSLSSTEDTPTVLDQSPLPSTDNVSQWKEGDLCMCPYNDDGLLYNATIVTISASLSTVLFDDYGNEEVHPLSDLQLRTDENIDHEDADVSAVPAPPPPPPPPFPDLPSNSVDDQNGLSATLMSWYLAGYHTGYYQALKQQQA